jgi:hypothetical protein
MAKYKEGQEVLLYGMADTIRVPEIRVRYNRGKELPKIRDSKSTYELLKKIYGREISIQEQMVVLFLDNALNVLGYYRHTRGTRTGTMIDIPMVLGIAVKALARSIILSHNHPSESNRPSEADRKMTVALEKAARTLTIQVLDHVIVTKDNGYYSIADRERILDGLGNSGNGIENQLRQEIYGQLTQVTPYNAPKVHRLIQSESGYRDVEQRIIQLVVRDRITPSACIPQIENEL